MKNKFYQLFALAIFSVFSISIYASDAVNLKTLQPQFIRVPGGQMEYYRFGHGTPLVMVTGYLANVKFWNTPLLSALATDHDVIIFDNRNTGGSMIASKSYTMHDLAGDTYALCHALHLQHVNLLGISMGGMIAQKVAIQYPGFVEKLILINTMIAGKAPTMPNQSVQNMLYNPPHEAVKRYISILDTLFPAGTRFHMFFTVIWDRFNPHYKETRIPTNVIKAQQNVILAWEKDTASLRALRQIKIPVLLLSGGSDAVLPPQNMNVLQQNIPHAVMYRFQDGGHAMTFQYPIEIANLINQFLAK